MRTQTAIAKITRPRLPDVLPRTRLFRLLDRVRKDTPVIWVSGPAGSGKTTLVSSYLDSRKLPSLWYQVDEGDADLATFFYYMGLAARKAAPRYKRPLPLFTREYGLGVPTFTRRFFENLCSRLSPPYVLVFDNYKDVGEQADLAMILQDGLAAIQEGIFVIIMSRREPPPALTSLRANGRMENIGWNELRLDEEEARGMLQLRHGDGLPDDVVRRIYALTQGWAAGLVLMMGRAQSTCDAPESPTREGVFQYFAEEIFQRIDQSVRDFLLKTVFLPKITASAAEKLTGLPQADELLTSLVRRNFFTGSQTRLASHL